MAVPEFEMGVYHSTRGMTILLLVADSGCCEATLGTWAGWTALGKCNIVRRRKVSWVHGAWILFRLASHVLEDKEACLPRSCAYLTTSGAQRRKEKSPPRFGRSYHYHYHSCDVPEKRLERAIKVAQLHGQNKTRGKSRGGTPAQTSHSMIIPGCSFDVDP
ncbi:predicted protein [Histoplasma capsulatum G186AR]|uniref:Uncharacterized protein n=1 Tax=Ajellomyces capsulatus (strain G186AR / H82 / ATCC MYA-2454 / RMSCC 2432) TaxID=447093 RepID=C0NLF0_AJECG|nr:uncharacterized protein HCBG_04330 [Histoplasma capsulatum G186AR]EEH07451.1 predicted protein [Histoplasma capsulatum G186AR]